MELPDRYLLLAATLSRSLLLVVEAKQADVVTVLVVEQALDLIAKLLGLAGSQHLHSEAVRQRHFLLQSVQPAVDYNEAELTVQQVSAKIWFRPVTLAVKLQLHPLPLNALPAKFRH